jgi:hypothetical protein
LKRSLNISTDFVGQGSGSRRLPHAQSAEREQRPDVPARVSLYRNLPALHPHPRR